MWYILVLAKVLIISLTVTLYSGWNVQHTARKVHSTSGEKLLDKSVSKSCSKQGYIKLVACHWLVSLVLNLRVNAL